MVPTLQEAKEWLGLNETDTFDDARIQLLLRGSVEAFENYAQTALIQRSFTQEFEGSEDQWFFDHSPVVSITSIVDPAAHTILSTQYLLHKRIGLLDFYSFAPTPRNSDGTRALWTVTYVAGHFTLETDVPMGVRIGLLGMMAKWYFNPEPMVQSRRLGDEGTSYIPNPSSTSVVPPEIETFWAQYRMRNI